MLAQVQFTPDGQFLLTGARQDPHLLCWDVRIQAGTTGDHSRLQLWVLSCVPKAGTTGDHCNRRLVVSIDGQVVCRRLAPQVILVGCGGEH